MRRAGLRRKSASTRSRQASLDWRCKLKLWADHSNATGRTTGAYAVNS